MWGLVLSIILNLQQYPVMGLSDSAPVYMRTTTFRIAVGNPATGKGWDTKAECQAYSLPPNPTFFFSYVDTSGNPQTVEEQNIPINVVGCERVL